MTMAPEQPPLGGKRTPPQPVDTVVSVGSAVNAVKNALVTGGEIARFSGQILRSLPETLKYWPEIFRQAAILVLGSALIIWLMEFIVGTMCGTEAIYTLKQVGAPLYSGIFNAWCAVREMTPYMWGYILSAKVGCGLVAEIGSMRIADEVDAIEVMGIDSMVYLVGDDVPVPRGGQLGHDVARRDPRDGVRRRRRVTRRAQLHLLAVSEPARLHLLHV
jgi:phospholipid/cholesterol/gamma-HCH transport system permease protein